MTANKTTQYRVTPKAREDLKEIWRYGAETWSPDQADIYLDGLLATLDTLVAQPTITRDRVEFDPPVRIHPAGPHLIICTIEEDHIRIVRLLGARNNWAAMLGSLDD